MPGSSRLDGASHWLTARDPEILKLGRRATLVYLLVGCTLIAGWHGAFARESGKLDASHSATPGGVGLPSGTPKAFFYFFHYTGHFPITWTGKRDLLVERRKMAQRLIEPRALARPDLANEDGVVLRKGDFGQIFLLYPDYWAGVPASQATARTFNRWLAVGASLALFVSLSLYHHKVLAIVLVAVIGSNPYLLHHVHVDTNVWSYPIQVAGLMLALCAPLLFGTKSRRWHFAIPAVAGVFLATVREVRTEPALLIASVVLACVFGPGTWRRRAGLVATLLFCAMLTAQLWSSFWTAKIEEAIQVVDAAGGSAFHGDWNLHHSVWHPIWFGLGDFGKDKGYYHDDHAAYRYAMPILNERNGTRFEFGGWVYKDPSGKRTKPETIPEYQEVLREKILTDIRTSPGWYLNILRQRAQRIFSHTTPVRLAVGAHYVTIPWSGWLALPLLGALAALRRWPELKLLLFYTPTSLPAFLMIAMLGYLHPSAYHLMAFALVATFLIHAGIRAIPWSAAANPAAALRNDG